MSAYDHVRAVWRERSRDGHLGMSDAFRIVAAVENSDSGRRALAELLASEGTSVVIDPDALSYLRIARDLPLPPGVQDNRGDAYFRTRPYTGARLSHTHRVRVPNELLYFDYGIVMITGTLDDVTGVRALMAGSGYEPVVVRTWGREKAIGIIMVNDFRDTTFGPYREVIFMVTSLPSDTPTADRTVDFVNPFSLQTPLDRGATTYVLKLWLDELSPIDGGNDFLGTNKELGAFSFTRVDDTTGEFRSWDKSLDGVVRGVYPRVIDEERARRGEAAYRAAAAGAGTTIASTTVGTIPVASRPDDAFGKPACRWTFAVDWRRTVLTEVTDTEVQLRFGDSEWGRRFGGLGFTPQLSFHSPAGVGQITHQPGDCPYCPTADQPRTSFRT